MVEVSPTSTITPDKSQVHEDGSTTVQTTATEGHDEQLNNKEEKKPPTIEMQEGYRVVDRSILKSLIIVIVVTMSMIVNTGNSTSVAISLPTVGKELEADASLLQWIVSAYALSSGCLLLVCGRLADLYGRKKAYLLGTFVLAAFTLGCGFSNNIITLIILRGIQGIGAAATIPASLGILAHAFPPSKARAWAFATFAAGAPIGAAFGAAIGGVLTQKTTKTWRSAYYMFTAVNVLCLIGGFLSIDGDPLPHPKEDRKVDWVGAFLITAALVMILFVLGDGESAKPKQWATGYIIALLIVGVFLVGVFLYWQWVLEKAQNERQSTIQQREEEEEEEEEEGKGKYLKKWNMTTRKLPPPIMKLSLWGRAKGRFAVMMAIVFLTWSSFLAWTFWIQLYYQDFAGLTPLQTVARQTPTFIVGAACNAFVGIMASHMSMLKLSTIGTLGTAVACLLYAVINPKATYWAFGFPSMVLSVLGVEFVFTSGTLYIAKISLPHEQSLAGAVFQTMTQIGTSAGVTISTVVFNRVTASLNEGEDMLRSYQAAQWTCCAFALCGTVLALSFFRGVGVPGHQQVKTPEVEQGGMTTDSSEDEEEVKARGLQNAVKNPEESTG